MACGSKEYCYLGGSLAANLGQPAQEMTYTVLYSGMGFSVWFFLFFSSMERLSSWACWPHVLNKYLAHPSIYQYGSYGVSAGGLSVLVFTCFVWLPVCCPNPKSKVIMQRRLEEAVTSFKNHMT